MQAKMSPALPENPFILRGEGFQISFYEYHSETNGEAHRLLRERKYTVGDTDLTYRLINNWDENDLLPNGAESGDGWRKFNLVEMLWLRAIIHFRNFGLPLEKILKIKKAIMHWDKNSNSYQMFEYYIMRALISDTDPFIVVLEDGSADLASSNEIEISKMISKPADMLLVSLKAIVAEMGMTPEKTKGLIKLSPEEEELIQEVRFRNDEVKAKIDPDGKITEIESTETVTDVSPAHEIQHKIKDRKMYGKVVTQYENGDRRSVKITKKRRLDKN